MDHSSQNTDDARFPDLAGYLSGAWAAERTIQDRLAETTGVFAGTQVFRSVSADGSEVPESVRTAAAISGGSTPSAADSATAAPNAAAPSAGLLRAEEQGTLRMDLPGSGPVESQVFRNHWWVVRGSAAEVFFEDGRPFHSLSLADGAHSPAHWCSPDQYDGEFSLASASAWEHTWEVRGPKKNLCLHTRLTRLDEQGQASPIIEVSAAALLVDAPDTRPENQPPPDAHGTPGCPGQQGAVVLVRKRGTGAFMFPGGKPEPGETPLESALRETREELSLTLEPAQLSFLGSVRTQAANEAGTDLLAHLYCVDLRSKSALSNKADLGTGSAAENMELQEIPALAPAAEIEELALLPTGQLSYAVGAGVEPGTGTPLAPLATEHMFPRLLQLGL